MLNFFQVPIRRQQLLLAAIDVVIILVSLPVAVLIRRGAQQTDVPAVSLVNFPATVVEFCRVYTGATTIAIVVYLSLFFVFDLYNIERRTGSLRDFLYILLVCGVVYLTVPVTYYFFPFWKIGRGFFVIQAILVAGGAFAWRAVYSHVHKAIARPRKTLIIGAGRNARALLEEIHQRFRNEIEVVGVLEDDPAKADFDLNGFRVIGGTKEIRKVVKEREVEIVVFAIPRQNNPIDNEVMREILGLKATGTEVYQMPTFFKKITGRIPVEFIEDSWLIFGQGFVPSATGVAARVRRLADIVISLTTLAVLSPLILAIAIAVKVTSRGPVFFRQERLGLNRRPYKLIKFRTMAVDAEKAHGPVWSSGKRDVRVTRVGRLLRRTRMDEIPNFLNILIGDMSMVGPRPERAHFVEMLEREIPYYGLRFIVKPGLTGWAQVNYSYGASLEDARTKLQYEMYYLQERSLFLDLVILLKTAQTVMLRPGS